MALFDEILDAIDGISPTQFLWIYLGTWTILLILGYFLAGGLYAFMNAVMLIVSVIIVYKYKNPPIIKNNSVFLIPLIGLLYAGIFNSGLLFQPELISDKSQAQVLTGVIPNEHEYVRGSGKNSKSYYYLTINGTRLHCDDDNYDDCELAYAHKGQTATVYHYEGLAYEIDVGGQKIYEFHHQADKFKATQHKKMQQFIWAMILFGIPSVAFFFINKRVIRDMAFISDEQLKANQQEQQLAQKLKSKQINSRLGAGGWAWRILFGLLAVLSLIIAFLMFTISHFIGVGVFLVMMVVLYYLARMPLKNAKAEVAQYHEMMGDDVGELSEYLSVGFYNYMGVFSWLMMYILCPCVLLAVMFALVYMSKEEWFACFVFLLPTVVMAGGVLFLIKRAIENRNVAFE